MSSSSTYQAPASILIIGSGVFGLSTALSLCLDPKFSKSRITLIDRSTFPPTDTASVYIPTHSSSHVTNSPKIDSSRIVRSDYADRLYADLGADALDKWRTLEWAGTPSCYHENGLVFAAGPGYDKYVLASYDNVSNLAKEQDWSPGSVEFLADEDAISKAGDTGGVCGEIAYLNRRSGWVNAAQAMTMLYKRVEKLGRIDFVTGTVTRLIFSPDSTQILGVTYTAAEGLKEIRADLTILAAGAWSPSLLDLRGRVHCTAHPLGYVPLTLSEAKSLSEKPVQMEFFRGLFIIPPPNPSDCEAGTEFYLKIAQHCHGVHNPVTISHPERLNETMKVSIPTTKPFGQLPLMYRKDMRLFLAEITTSPFESRHTPFEQLNDRPLLNQRLCHYADTPTGDFLVDYVPRYGKSLFIATGGSGHGFKFLPVIGDHIVACITGNKGPLEDKWAWKEAVTMSGNDWEWGAGDGSRSGAVGVMLDKALAERDEEWEKDEPLDWVGEE
jgi:sarcosine oxidase/L-pipecolate oxidase